MGIAIAFTSTLVVLLSTGRLRIEMITARGMVFIIVSIGDVGATVIQRAYTAAE